MFSLWHWVHWKHKSCGDKCVCQINVETLHDDTYIVEYFIKLWCGLKVHDFNIDFDISVMNFGAVLQTCCKSGSHAHACATSVFDKKALCNCLVGEVVCLYETRTDEPYMERFQDPVLDFVQLRRIVQQDYRMMFVGRSERLSCTQVNLQQWTTRSVCSIPVQLGHKDNSINKNWRAKSIVIDAIIAVVSRCTFFMTIRKAKKINAASVPHARSYFCCTNTTQPFSAQVQLIMQSRNVATGPQHWMRYHSWRKPYICREPCSEVCRLNWVFCASSFLIIWVRFARCCVAKGISACEIAHDTVKMNKREFSKTFGGQRSRIFTLVLLVNVQLASWHQGQNALSLPFVFFERTYVCRDHPWTFSLLRTNNYLLVLSSFLWKLSAWDREMKKHAKCQSRHEAATSPQTVAHTCRYCRFASMNLWAERKIEKLE